MLSEAGAEVVKVERPSGDDMRTYPPTWDEAGGAAFALLNEGKESIVADLTDPHTRDAILALTASFDIVVEQFRPGVMAKFGLDYDAVRAVNPGIIYCSITGYGQNGPLRRKAGHDVNYLGDTGVLAISCGKRGHRVLPALPLADIAGGTYPAVINILLALRQRDIAGTGCNIDVAMSPNLFTLAYLPWAKGHLTNSWPENGKGAMTGGSPRYNLYDTKDDGVLIVAALEQKFWLTFTRAIGLEDQYISGIAGDNATIARVQEIIGAEDAAYWDELLSTKDCCCSIMRDLRSSLDDDHFSGRLPSKQQVRADGNVLPSLPLPISSIFTKREPHETKPPRLGSSNEKYGL
jgi:crotonobetainyl-CoA:carnitine CoA-transferase CaiB-like acyl-CoA transferase